MLQKHMSPSLVSVSTNSRAVTLVALSQYKTAHDLQNLALYTIPHANNEKTCNNTLWGTSNSLDICSIKGSNSCLAITTVPKLYGLVLTIHGKFPHYNTESISSTRLGTPQIVCTYLPKIVHNKISFPWFKHKLVK